MLGHRAAEFFDRLAHFRPDFTVGLVGFFFAGDLFAAEFFLGLSGAEEIGRQLSAAHVVEDLLALFQAFAAVDVLRAEATVEAHVAVVLEDGVVAGLDHSGVFGGAGQLAVVSAQFGADGEAALGLHLFVGEFLAAGLDGEIRLPLGNDFLGRVGVLDDEVTRVARHHHGLDAALGTLADLDHIGDLNEMIVHALAAVEAGGASGFDDGLEIAIVGVAEHLGEVAARPVFVARRVGAADGFKWRDFLAHRYFVGGC